MSDKECSKNAQEFAAIVESMDKDAQVALLKFMEMVNALPEGTPFPARDEADHFIEQARLESIRRRLGGNVGQLVPFPTHGMRTDVKPSVSRYAVVGPAIERALLGACARTVHISDNVERAIAESRAAAEEAGAEHLSLVAKWLAATAPELHAAFLAEFGRT